MFTIHFLYAQLVLAVGLIVAVPLYFYRTRRRRDLFEPMYVLSLTFFTQFWLRSCEALWSGNPFWGQPPYDDWLIETWAKTWSYLNCAYVLFLVGYYSPVPRALASRLPPLPREWHAKSAVLAIGGLTGAGLLGYSLVARAVGGVSVFL